MIAKVVSLPDSIAVRNSQESLCSSVSRKPRSRRVWNLFSGFFWKITPHFTLWVNQCSAQSQVLNSQISQQNTIETWTKGWRRQTTNKNLQGCCLCGLLSKTLMGYAPSISRHLETIYIYLSLSLSIYIYYIYPSISLDSHLGGKEMLFFRQKYERKWWNMMINNGLSIKFVGVP